MSRQFDTGGLSKDIAEEFETSDDLRSYLVCKFGGEYSERVLKEVNAKVTTSLNPEPPCRNGT